MAIIENFYENGVEVKIKKNTFNNDTFLDISYLSDTLYIINPKVYAFKGIEIGSGFKSASQFGSKVHDEIGYHDGKFTRYTNNAGGVEGGMSNAQPIILWMSMKPS